MRHGNPFALAQTKPQLSAEDKPKLMTNNLIVDVLHLNRYLFI